MIFPSRSGSVVGVNGKKEIESVPCLVPIARIHVLFRGEDRDVEKVDFGFRAIFADGYVRRGLQCALF
jgi:hypothetical protein